MPTIPFVTVFTASTLSAAAATHVTTAPSSGTATDLVSSATGRIARISWVNPNASKAYLKIFNVAAGSVTVGTTVPWIIVELGVSETNGFTVVKGLSYSAASLSYCVVTEAGTGGASAPASAVTVNIDTI